MSDDAKQSRLEELILLAIEKIEAQAKEIKQLKEQQNRMALQVTFTGSEKETLIKQVNKIHSITHPSARASEKKADRMASEMLYVKSRGRIK